MKNTLIKLAAIACIAGFGAVVSAGTVTMKYTGNTGLNSVTIPSNGSYSAGHLSYQVQGGGTYNTFCIEVAEYTNSSYRVYDIVNLADAPDPGSNYGQAKADAVVAIIAKAVDMGWINTSLQATPGALDAENNADRMSAIQASIWSALFGASTPTSSDSDVNNNIQSLLSLAPAENTSTFYLMQSRLRAAVNDGAQDQLYVVPLPTSALAGLGMLGGIAGIRIVRRRHT